MTKTVFVIAGPNGAGKTTFAKEFLPHFAHCDEFVNADLIATGLSPFDPSSAALQAGRLVLKRIGEHVKNNATFGFETTLSGKAYYQRLLDLKKKKYQLWMFFLWLPNVNLALKRVSDRVLQGGHNVPEIDVRRRYMRGLENFWTLYRPILDNWILYNNAYQVPKAIVTGKKTEYNVLDESEWSELKKMGVGQ